MKNNESITSLYGHDTVKKDSPQIMLRGEIDSLLARAIAVCAYAKGNGFDEIYADASEIVHIIKMIMNSEASACEIDITEILKMTLDELREVSYNPKKKLDADHYFPDENSDMMTANLNLFRTDIRRTERYCVAAGLENSSNRCIQKVLNRLSSAVYIMMIKHNFK
ncbi:MAG: hypothetical protein RR504_01570 [Christensenellaceae bacterium]